MSVQRLSAVVLAAVALGTYATVAKAQPVQANSPNAGIITTYAGGGAGAGVATTVPQDPWGLLLSGSTLYITDGTGTSGYNNRSWGNVVRALDVNTGLETVVAGNGLSGTTGDGGLATKAEVINPRGLALDGARNLYFATGN